MIDGLNFVFAKNKFYLNVLLSCYALLIALCIGPNETKAAATNGNGADPVKPKYSLLVDKITIESYNETLLANPNVGYRQIDDLAFAFWASVTTLYDFGDDIDITLKILSMTNNGTYREIPLGRKRNYCEVWKGNMWGYDDIKTHGNFTGCGLIKAHYVLTEYIPDIYKYPTTLPAGNYMLNLRFTIGKDKFEFALAVILARILPAATA